MTIIRVECKQSCLSSRAVAAEDCSCSPHLILLPFMRDKSEPQHEFCLFLRRFGCCTSGGGTSQAEVVARLCKRAAAGIRDSCYAAATTDALQPHFPF